MACTRQAQAPGRTDLRPVAATVDLPPLKSVRLLDQLRERIRLLHDSLRTEEAYVYWARAFIRFHGLRHPSELSAADVEAYLNHLVNVRRLSKSSHGQALHAYHLSFDHPRTGERLAFGSDDPQPLVIREPARASVSSTICKAAITSWA